MLVAVDIGGTFTDIIGVKDDGEIVYYKGLSTPKNPEIGVKEGVQKLGINIDTLIHATTIATNSLLGQVNLELPKTALMTTKGFSDIIEIGRQNRPELYNLFFEKPKPLVPRELRFEVDERINSRGDVLKPLNTQEVEELAKKINVDAIAVVFLHSYLNSIHEKMAKEILSRYVKYVTASYEVSPEQREYERTTTTVINVMLKPLVSKYIESLWKEIKPREFFIVASSGGLIDANEAIERPVQLIESGPAAGVVGVKYFADEMNIKNAISFDMGGTTAKAGSIVNGEIEITNEYEVGGRTHHGRIIKGSGYPVRFPFIDLAEVSAGGGTIIWLDESGGLNVGPLSAGADPGPMCYNKGGNLPTLTDANLVLGRIGEELLSGYMKLNKELAIKGFEKLGDPIQVAKEAVRLATLEMARAIRLVTVERGLDPSEFTLFSFGGAGPQFAADIAEELSIKRILIPVYPGLFSALSMLLADIKIEIRRAYPKDIEREFRELEEELRKKMSGIDYFLRYADVRYKGQGWELTVPADGDIRRNFEQRHKNAYGFTLPYDIEIVNIRVFGIKRIKKPKLTLKISNNVKVKRRKVYFDDWIDAKVFIRETLPIGFKEKGPAVIEEYSATTVIPEGWTFTVLPNYFIELMRE
ncbi:hydantoinase/oxoprolinase family protein [Sulfolobus sp. S-194]|uniref:hydantoinase/oxoprolinase family protein n=1 Tax=Sulfolobus sp. S-194 TaxID=2512240 RepID=UPI001436D16F|nr:hydantoinase/oxoprolinase family protein [Sulfolobus sp. S-194]QIW24571.1 hydantoinase/oxoprolinase family protein [Sulfolobus sp. S-194]